MCGICGAFQVGGPLRPVLSPWTLDRMTDALVHRGPNERGTYQRRGAALGIRRLSIVDVAEGQQPMSTENGRVWAVQNGELYNHEAIRRELSRDGHVLSTRCDTEVIPHLYERHGTRFMEHLRGKFAIAVWDEQRGRGVVTRDRMGVKPLYYAQVDDRLLFASELKSLLVSGLVGDELDYEAIEAYLTLGYFPAPRTPLAGVSKLPPGHRLVVEHGRVAVEPYWSYPEPVGRGAAADERDLGEELLDALDEAVRLRLMSDVPLGAMLSGGLDSSLVVALMARHSAGRVKTFSVGFAGATNELDDARLVARHFGTDHHELELSVADAVDLPELVWTLDEPLADLSTIGFYGLSALAAQDVTVALSGQGADELLGGYRKHQAAALLARWQRLPQPLRRVPERLATGANGRLQRAGRALGAQDPVSRLLAMSGLVTNWSTSPLRSGALAEADGSVARAVLADRLRGYDGGPLETTLFLDAQLALVDHMLHYFDRASMAHSLEVRVPFLDHHVVELCARIPPGLKVRGLTTKYLLRRIAEPLVPARVLEKKKVGFFHSAVGAWLDGQAKAATAEYLLDERPQFAGFLDPQAVRSLVAKPDASGSERRLVLAILMLEVWLRTFVPRARVESRLPQRESLSA